MVWMLHYGHDGRSEPKRPWRMWLYDPGTRQMLSYRDADRRATEDAVIYDSCR
jgi:hypothetical protein